MRWLTADEGGLAPPVQSAEEMLGNAVESIEKAGLVPGKDAFLAVDVASSHFYENEKYYLDESGLSASQMVDQLEQWVDQFPIASLEDGLAEDDWENWPALLTRLKGKCLVLGDDLLCTNPKRIQKAINEQSCDALLLKVNQIGTLSEALEAYQLSKAAGWKVTILCVVVTPKMTGIQIWLWVWSGDQTKAGSNNPIGNVFRNITACLKLKMKSRIQW